VPYRDFVASGETDQDQKAGAKGFIDLFIEKRLFVTDTDPQGEVAVSVAHEALLREWRRIKEWLKENREFLRMRDRLDLSLKAGEVLVRADHRLGQRLARSEAQHIGELAEHPRPF
jgi:hypothetical protein